MYIIWDYLERNERTKPNPNPIVKRRNVSLLAFVSLCVEIFARITTTSEAALPNPRFFSPLFPF